MPSVDEDEQVSWVGETVDGNKVAGAGKVPIACQMSNKHSIVYEAPSASRIKDKIDYCIRSVKLYTTSETKKSRDIIDQG